MTFTFKKILSFSLAFAIAFSLSVSVSAADTDGVGELLSGAASFGEWATYQSFLGIQLIGSAFDNEICPSGSVDDTHDLALRTTVLDGVVGDYYCCSRCGYNTGVTFEAAYATYVSELPVSFVTYGNAFYSYNGVVLPALPERDASVYPYAYISRSNSMGYAFYFCSVPVEVFNNGSFYCKPTDSCDVLYGFCFVDGTEWESITKYRWGVDNSLGDVDVWTNTDLYYGSELYLAASAPVFYANVAEVETEYGITAQSRPLSIIGNYGIVGDGSTVVNVYNTTPFDEETLVFTEPQTGIQYQTTGWTYDYNDRTYLLDLESGTMTVNDTDVAQVGIVYGDEEMLIGYLDTSGNLLVYDSYVYLVSEDTSSGDDDESTGDEACDHAYTSETTKAATCLLAGKETFTCSECGDTYTKTIPATGHDWSVLQSVTSQYDDTGALVTEGYTIYQCAACGEQYKSTDGSAPPGGSSSSGGTIWEKIGTLFGTIADGVIGMIETAISTLLDGLISLATVISEKGQRVIELILGFFEKIPELFGAFPDFLGAVFPFIPEDFLLIIEFGLAAVVFAAIIKFIKKG